MKFSELIIGRPLRTEEQQRETIGVWTGVAILGLDALASASYGPEAALTALAPVGPRASLYILSTTAAIVVVLLAVFFSYLQTISAYSNGGGSYIVAKDNLGRRWGLLAATALSLDYVLNVAVAISSGVGAAVSAAPALLPYTVWLCLGLLMLLTLVNLRGVRTTGLLFAVPTAAFVISLLTVIALGIWKSIHADGHPTPAIPPVTEARVVATPTLAWLWLRAFASGCSALTGVEAVSNAVPVFRKPSVPHARRTLCVIVVILTALLCGIAALSYFYRVTATPPGQAGYESIVSQVVKAVMGRGHFYYIAVGATLLVLALSANTSFTDFPRVCRLLALDGYLPREFGRRGSRLVYTFGILSLTFFAGVLLVAFGGVTDRLIPLFAIGAFFAFTLSQFGMVFHWLRAKPRRPLLATINGIGGTVTAFTLLLLVVAKFGEGAWITVLAVPAIMVIFFSIARYNDRIDREIAAYGPIRLRALRKPVILIPMKRLDRVTRKALRLALSFSDEIHVLEILDEDPGVEDLADQWSELVEQPIRAIGRTAPTLITIRSSYREFFEPLIDYVKNLAAREKDRCIAVWIPEVAERRWYTFILRHRATQLKRLLLLHGLPQIVVINTPWYVEEEKD